MAAEDLKGKMKDYLQVRFEGRASSIFLSRVGTIIDNMPDNPSAMDDGLNNVRIAVKLLFDDTLSDDIYEELRLMAKYPDRS
jgi:hypothetical protein